MFRLNPIRARIFGKSSALSSSLNGSKRFASGTIRQTMSVFQTSLQNNLLPSLSMSANLYPSVTIQNIQKRSFASGDTFLDAGEVTERILAVVKSFDKCDASKVTPTAKFKEDLGLDSLDIVEVVMAIEEEFALEIPDNEADKITTIEEAIQYISAHPAAK